jgi:hypothetical protein
VTDDLTRACMAGLVVYLMAGLAYNVKQKGMEMGPEALPHASLCSSLASGFGGLLVWTLPACKHPSPFVCMRLGLVLSNQIARERARDSTPCPPNAFHFWCPLNLCSGAAWMQVSIKGVAERGMGRTGGYTTVDSLYQSY